MILMVNFINRILNFLKKTAISETVAVIITSFRNVFLMDVEYWAKS